MQSLYNHLQYNHHAAKLYKEVANIIKSLETIVYSTQETLGGYLFA